ncbi:MAG: sugar transferase, partial [Acidimicrobiia bacterium]
QGINEMTSVYFKMRRDPRVTPLGRFLRRLSLDEIPSLWSVLRGDLSLVGPRPVRAVETEYLKSWHWERFAVRPGLTSPWVLNGKNAITDFDDVVRSDLKYVRNWSLRKDLQILVNTARYVLSGKNH